MIKAPNLGAFFNEASIVQWVILPTYKKGLCSSYIQTVHAVVGCRNGGVG